MKRFINDIEIFTLVYDIKFIDGRLEGIETRCRIDYPKKDLDRVLDDIGDRFNSNTVGTDFTGNQFIVTGYTWEF
jgi:hypothetical protein